MRAAPNTLPVLLWLLSSRRAAEAYDSTGSRSEDSELATATGPLEFVSAATTITSDLIGPEVRRGPVAPTEEKPAVFFRRTAASCLRMVGLGSRCWIAATPGPHVERGPPTTSFEYGNPDFPHYINAIKDPRGVTPMRAEHDGLGKLD